MIPEYVKIIKSMHLSPAGEAEAAAYAPQVIATVDAKMLKVTKQLDNRVAYFFKLCNLVSQDLNLEPDPARSADIHNYQGTHDRMSKIISNGRNPSISIASQIPKREQPSAAQGLGSSATSDSVLSPQASLRRSSLIPSNLAQIPFNCPCVYRKRWNKDYICYGMWCSHDQK